MKLLRTMFFIVIFYSIYVYPQHRGDNLSFQGITFENNSGTKALAMGNAFTSVTGEVLSVFYNPAGLADINKFQISVSGGYLSKLWRENQNYRPNRFFVTLPFYLEGLYIPDPADNGRWDYEIARDTNKNYPVNLPELGLDPFSEDAADWQRDIDKFSLGNAALALPITIAGENIVFSAALARKNIYDFDRNDTYLDPHPGYDFYGEVGQVNGLDTMVVKWSKYLRQREGNLNNLTGAVAYSINKYLKAGVGFTYIWGNSDDISSLSRIGSFDLVRENRFRFYYQNVHNEISGTSEYSGSKFNAGVICDLGKVKLGINVDFPYTFKREWSYNEFYSDSISGSESTINGTDEFKVPAVFTAGLSFSPVETFLFSLDIEMSPFSKASFSLADSDTMFRKWVDRTTFRFGAEFKATDFLSILAGYRDIPQTFVPDGAAFQDKGPSEQSFTAGISFSLFSARLDLAYEIKRLKYYDSYFSNTNYVYETFNSLSLGLMYSFSVN